MKRFTKISLIICGICFLLGSVLVVAGSILGGGLRQYLKIANDVSREVNELVEKSGDEKNIQVTPPGEGQYAYDQSFPEDIQKLEISAFLGDVQLKNHGEDGIRVVANHGGKSFRCSVQGKELRIEDQRNTEQPQLELTVFLPDRMLSEIELEMAAGVLNAERLSAGEVHVEISAGECVIRELLVSDDAELRAGAGSLRVEQFSGRELDIECGAGEIAVCLNGSFEDYNYETEVAMGTVVLGDISYSGFGEEKKIRNNASAHVEVNCAAGNVEIGFTETE